MTVVLGEDVKRTREDFMVNGVVVSEVTDTGIYGLFGEYRCLSNFHMYPILVEGLWYECSEAAFMAQKTTDPAIKRKFSQLTSASEAKKLGRQIQLRPNWDNTIRMHAMYRVLLSKFLGGDKHSREVLLSTGKKYIEETNWWNDQYWGVCAGVGENNLGRTLMTIRDLIHERT